MMRSRLSLLRVAAAAAIGLSLGACARQDRMVTGSIIPTDVRARHPIVLANAPQTLDLFVSGEAALDVRQKQDVVDFAKSYVASGSGPIQILVPRGTGQEARAQNMAGAVRATLVAGGVRGHIDVSSYAVADPRLAAPVRVTFAALEARADRRCGEWPDDLGASGSSGGWDNRPYYNFGCAYQQNMAAQIADPRDLVRPRHLEPADSPMRIRAITGVRDGVDPGTKWSSSPSYIGNVSP
jgi:pilus assembly protein CpaD